MNFCKAKSAKKKEHGKLPCSLKKQKGQLSLFDLNGKLIQTPSNVSDAYLFCLTESLFLIALSKMIF